MAVRTPVPDNERARLEELLSFEILDTPPDPSFDSLAALAAQLCDAPMAFVTLVDRDREWFKATFGVSSDFRELPRDGGFCATAILRPFEPLMVNDASRDPRFADTPSVAGDFGLRFYCGAPIISADGFALGTLSVVDTTPRDLTPRQLASLETLASFVAEKLELRRVSLDVELAGEEQERLRQELDREGPLLSNASIAAVLSNSSALVDRLGKNLRAATDAANAGDTSALTEFSARTTGALQALLLCISQTSQTEAGSDRAARVASALSALAPF